MKRLLKKYFIPHFENEYKPHLFRGASLIGMFSIVIVLFLVAVGGNIIIKRSDLTALVLPKVLVDYANSDRQEGNYKTLAINTVLEKAAQMKANDMAERGYFAHKSPEGRTPWYWFEQAGYDFAYAGENLAVNFSDSIDVNKAWMESPSHRDNILNGNFTEIGVATAQGFYNGRMTTFIVQLFGKPAAKPETKPETKTASTAKPAENKIVVIKVTSKATSTSVVTVASSSVLGASGENDLYIAVEKTEESSATTSSGEVEGKYSSYFERFILSPENSLTTLYFLISIIILVGLILMIAVEARIQHPTQIAIAVLIIVLMCVLLFLYKSVLFPEIMII